MSKKNALKPNSERTHEELVANGRKGGIKSAEARRRSKELRALLGDFLSTPVAFDTDTLPDELVRALRKAGYKDITLKERGALLLAWKMSLGDIRAALLVSKMIGEYTEELAAADMSAATEAQPVVITVASAEEAQRLADAVSAL